MSGVKAAEYVLIVFGEDWGGLPSSTQHLIRNLPDRGKVLWINSIGLRAPQVSIYDFTRIFRKLVGQAVAGAHSSPLENMTVLSPRVLPWHGQRWARRLNGRLLSAAIRRYCRSQGIEKAVLWISLPSAVCVLPMLEGWPVLYYCCDDFAALAGVDHKTILPLEKELAERADRIVVSSPDLATRFDNRKTHLVPHGVDIEHFGTETTRPDDLPTGRPIAGFYGSIANWLDVDLLEKLANQLPDWNFVLLGQVAADMKEAVSQLELMSNVFLLGAKPYSSLPAYVQHWEAALLPFVLNGQIEACNPLKLREYLASGTAVVSTDFPEARKYGDCIQLADNAEEFALALGQVRVEAKDRKNIRINRVAGEAWAKRGAEISALLHELVASSD